jgi:chromodomain-helicase-DNA-binding protein 4
MKSREIIKQFELEHEVKKPGTTGAKFHVLVTTYESLNNPKDFTPVFKSVPRWEVLIVDEGQRRKEFVVLIQTNTDMLLFGAVVKSDSSLLFRKLNELRSIHRIIMTGVSSCAVF